MTVFILPTVSPVKYRGKYPTRARYISGSTSRGTGRHIELNDGTRLWSATDRTPEYSAGALADDYAKVKARAVPMTAEQYETLREAAELSRSVVGIAGHGRRARIDEGVRAKVESIKADSRHYAKRNAEAARRDILAGETGRGFDPARPFRVRNKTPQFSGSFDFATLAEARDYLAAQIARRDSVVSGAAPVGPDANSQCPMESFIVWADGTETLGDMGWTPPSDGGPRWNAPAPVSPATAETMESAIASTIPGNPVREAREAVRRDNVEYHAGKAARAAGEPESACPYLAGGERAARWTLGWNEGAPAPLSDATRLTLICAALDSCDADLRMLAHTKGRASHESIDRADSFRKAVRDILSAA